MDFWEEVDRWDLPFFLYQAALLGPCDEVAFEQFPDHCCLFLTKIQQ